MRNNDSLDALKETLCFCYEQYLEEGPYHLPESELENVLKNAGISGNSVSCTNTAKSDNLVYTQLFIAFFELNVIQTYLTDISKSLENNDYEEVRSRSLDMDGACALLFTLITEIELQIRNEYNFVLDFFKFGYSDFFRSYKRFLSALCDGYDTELMKKIINSDLEYLHDKINLYKFFFPIYLILLSPFYSKTEKEYALHFLKFLKKMLLDATLQYIQIQQKPLSDKDIAERNSRDGTTRILGIFTRCNDDIYLFRIDLSHKNEEDIHINMHELKKGKLIPAGYPLEKSEVNSLNLSREQRNKIFLEDEKYFWFKIGNKKEIANLCVPQNEKDSLNKLFREQSHFIIGDSTEENGFLSFIKYFNEVLFKLNADFIKSECFDKQDEQNINLIIDIRDKINDRDRCYVEALSTCGDSTLKISEVMQMPLEIVEKIIRDLATCSDSTKENS